MLFCQQKDKGVYWVFLGSFLVLIGLLSAVIPWWRDSGREPVGGEDEQDEV